MGDRQSLTWRGVAPLHQPAAQAKGPLFLSKAACKAQRGWRPPRASCPVGAARLLGGSVTTLCSPAAGQRVYWGAAILTLQQALCRWGSVSSGAQEIFLGAFRGATTTEGVGERGAGCPSI